MSLVIEDFKSKLTGGGARANLFKVTLPYPGIAGGDTELTSFMAKGASLPGSSVAEVTVPFRGRQIKVAGDRTFDAFQITVINDTGFEIRNAFERWMNGINEHENGTGLTAMTDYQADITVEQLDRQNNVIKTIIVRGAFPTALQEIALSYDTNDAVEEFTVDFSYQYWTSGTTS